MTGVMMITRRNAAYGSGWVGEQAGSCRTGVLAVCYVDGRHTHTAHDLLLVGAVRCLRLLQV
jgi:hypothetical protein